MQGKRQGIKSPFKFIGGNYCVWDTRSAVPDWNEKASGTDSISGYEGESDRPVR